MVSGFFNFEIKRTQKAQIIGICGRILTSLSQIKSMAPLILSDTVMSQTDRNSQTTILNI